MGARREGNDYVISGRKLWATGAGAKGNAEARGFLETIGFGAR